MHQVPFSRHDTNIALIMEKKERPVPLYALMKHFERERFCPVGLWMREKRKNKTSN